MPDISHRVEIDADRIKIFPLVASAVGFAQWWAEDAVANDKGIVLGFFDRSTVYHLQSDTFVRPVSALWRCESGAEWEGTKIIFVLTPHENRTVLHFTHADWVEATDYFTTCNTTWGALMYRLKAAAEGRAPGPLFTRTGVDNG